jgi:hypothetical protein
MLADHIVLRRREAEPMHHSRACRFWRSYMIRAGCRTIHRQVNTLIGALAASRGYNSAGPRRLGHRIISAMAKASCSSSSIAARQPTLERAVTAAEPPSARQATPGSVGVPTSGCGRAYDGDLARPFAPRCYQLSELPDIGGRRHWQTQQDDAASTRQSRTSGELAEASVCRFRSSI